VNTPPLNWITSQTPAPEVDDDAGLELRIEHEDVVARITLEVVAAGSRKQRIIADPANEVVVA
jgi:hypothetical protein